VTKVAVLPACKKFIIEAIRKSRPVRKGKIGHSGKPLWRIYDLVKVYYVSDLQFFVDLNGLIKTNRVLLVKRSFLHGLKIVKEITDLSDTKSLIKRSSVYVIADGLPRNIKNLRDVWTRDLPAPNGQTVSMAKSIMSSLR
jgi:hypothetical protein